MGLGHINDVSPAEARDKADTARKLVAAAPSGTAGHRPTREYQFFVPRRRGSLLTDYLSV